MSGNTRKRRNWSKSFWRLITSSSRTDVDGTAIRSRMDILTKSGRGKHCSDSSLQDFHSGSRRWGWGSNRDPETKVQIAA